MKRIAVTDAARLYQRFTGHEPQSLGTVDVPPMPDAVCVIGDCDGVLYTTVRDGRVEKYVHYFRSRDRPLLTVSPDGRQLILVGGRYRFTSRGIIDSSDIKHRHVR